MVKKGNLFLLIKSLSRSEKRYFRLYATAGRDNANYLRLFDAIDEQDVYDEDAIRQKFEGEVFIRQLHVTKIYVAELVMKSLRNFHTGSSVNAQVLDALRDIELLFDKELYAHCLLKIDKAEQLCLRYEKQALLAEVLAWKRKLALAQSMPDNAFSQKLITGEKDAINKLADLNHYWDATLHLFSYVNDDGFAKKLDIKKASTRQAKTLHHHLLYSWYFMKGQPAKAEKEVSQLITMLEQDDKRIEDDPSSYITAIGNKIGMYIGQKRWQEVPHLLQKMRDVPSRYKLAAESKFTVRLWLRLYNLELEMYRDMQQPAKALKVIAEAELYIQDHKNAVPVHYRIMLYYQFAALYFLKKDYSLALDKVNDIINQNFGEVRTDLQCYARILNMLIHFELGNITVLRYVVHNCRRFFTKMKVATPFNKDILQMFSALSLARKDEYSAIVQKAYSKCFSAGINQPIQDYIDFSGWMRTKIKTTN